MASFLKPSSVAVVTGITGQIGFEIGKGVAATGASVVFAVRDIAKGEKAAEKVRKATGNAKVSVSRVDFDSLASIPALAAAVKAQHGDALDLLVNVAAVVPTSRTTTSDGVESQWAVNVLGYQAMMTAFKPMLAAASAGARIVNVASSYACDVDLTDVEYSRRRYDANEVYKQTKGANRMQSAHAAVIYAADGITVNACHPAVVTSAVLSNLGFSQGGDSPAQGAATPLFLALSPEAGKLTGKFVKDKRPVADSIAADPAKNKALWELCEAMIAKAQK